MYRRLLSSLLAAVVLTALFTGCDSFLQKSPQGELTSENFFRNGEDAQRALNSVYDYAQARSFDFFPPYPMIFGSIASDNATKGGESGSDQISVQRVEQFNPRPTDPYITSTWNTMYTGIYRANLVIANVPDIESMSASQREQIVGEAKFLRAYFHFYALKMYGLGNDRANDGPGIPLITEPLPASDADVPRTSEAEVWAQIETDLQDAATAMGPTAPDLGRATEGAAKALRVKAHVFQEEWSDAQTLAREIIDSGRYSLDPDYSRVFDQRGEFGPGSVFEINHVDPTAPLRRSMTPLRPMTHAEMPPSSRAARRLPARRATPKRLKSSGPAPLTVPMDTSTKRCGCRPHASPLAPARAPRIGASSATPTCCCGTRKPPMRTAIRRRHWSR